MPWWLATLLNWAARVVTQWLADKRAEQALRDLGAATERNKAHAEAERQEAAAHRAGAAAEDAPDNPLDLRKD